MIVYRVCGDEIGPNGNGALFCATKKEACEAAVEWWRAHDDIGPPLVDRLEIRNRADLAHYLNDAMGYGVT